MKLDGKDDYVDTTDYRDVAKELQKRLEIKNKEIAELKEHCKELAYESFRKQKIIEKLVVR